MSQTQNYIQRVDTKLVTTSKNVDSLIGSKLPKIELTCFTTRNFRGKNKKILDIYKPWPIYSDEGISIVKARGPTGS